MSRQSRIVLCRLSFITFCVTPTLAVAAWILWPDFAADWEGRLAERLELAVQVKDTSQPNLRTTMLSEVDFADPESGLLIARAEQIQLTTTSDATVAIVSKMAATADDLERFFYLLHDRSLRGWSGESGSLEVRIQELSLTPRAAAADSEAVEESLMATVLRDVTCKVSTLNSLPVARISFRMADSQNAEPIEIQATRKRVSGSPATTVWFINTNHTLLPCRLISWKIPQLAALGDQTQFNGVLWIEQSSRGVRAELDGQLESVDFDRFVTRRFPHRLSGLGQLGLKDVVFQDGRLQQASGTIYCEKGVISNSLLSQASRTLGWSAAPTSEPETAFRNLSCGFQIQGARWALQGRADSQGGLMSNEFGAPLLQQQQPRATYAVLDVIRVLDPRANVQGPLTGGSIALLNAFSVDAESHATE